MVLQYSPIVLILANFIASVWGHGYMIDPLSRNACYEEFPGNCPTNYNKNEQNCGGRNVQISLGGKCGVCGDKYGENIHIYPGKYATGFITKTYKQGQEITVKIHITANHKGWFEFRVGIIGTPPITQEKLTYLLKSPEGKTRYALEGSGSSYEYVKLVLPPGLTCDHCVIQWWWNVGNSWGCDDQGCGLGHGPQETFVNCADIQILLDGMVIPTTTPITNAPSVGTKATPTPTSTTTTNTSTSTTPNTNAPPVATKVAPTPTPTSTTTLTPTTTPTTNTSTPTTSNTNAPPVGTKVAPTPTPTTHTSTPTTPNTNAPPVGTKVASTPTPTTYTSTPTTSNTNAPPVGTKVAPTPTPTTYTSPPPITTEVPPQPPTTPPSSGKCKSTGAWKGQTAIDKWCVVNCAAGFCPKHMCICN